MKSYILKYLSWWVEFINTFKVYLPTYNTSNTVFDTVLAVPYACLAQFYFCYEMVFARSGTCSPRKLF
ncbi:MAG: hypothetical protein LBN95_05095 [Prevotellaceae bacterium]|nr:hypothetical protein [Prevotellaceae bacterium]